MQLSDQAEIVIVIGAPDIEKNKVRGDLGITYDEDVLRLMNEFTSRGLLCRKASASHVTPDRTVLMRSRSVWRSLESRFMSFIISQVIQAILP